MYKVQVVTLAQLAKVLCFHLPRTARGQALVIVFVKVLETLDRYTPRFTALWIVQSADCQFPANFLTYSFGSSCMTLMQLAFSDVAERACAMSTT
jgi:hypothetical protein